MATKNEKDQHEEFSSKISDEINCSICLDILVNPLTLVPCGHSFCTNCCLSDSTRDKRFRKTLCFTKCPQCRQPIKETVRPRQLENLINTLVTVPNLLFRNDDDKKQYLERREVENDRSQIIPSPLKTKKRRRQDNHLGNYDYAAASARAPHPHDYHYHSGMSYRTNYPAFDPMVAPLPPPYDFSSNGPVPILGLAAAAAGASNASRRRTTPTIRTSTTTTDNTSGVSASDPICID